MSEIELLRDRLAAMHRLNGWSKTKGWWCSCHGWRLRLPYASGDSLSDAVAAFAGVSPDLVQVIPNREGSTSDGAPA